MCIWFYIIYIILAINVFNILITTYRYAYILDFLKITFILYLYNRNNQYLKNETRMIYLLSNFYFSVNNININQINYSYIYICNISNKYHVATNNFFLYMLDIVMAMIYDYMIVNTALQLRRPHLTMILTEVSIHRFF